MMGESQRLETYMLTSKYQYIAGIIREQIDSGEITSGDPVPSVNEISGTYSVARATASAVLQQLKSEGLIDTKPGARSVVRSSVPLARIVPQRYYRPHHMPTWAREAERSGKTVHVAHESTRVTAPPHIAERLDIPGDAEVIATRYLITMDDQPVSMSMAYEPYALVGGTDIERPHEGSMAGRGIVPRFDAIGVEATDIHEALRFRRATADEADALLTEFVVSVQQTFRVDTGLPIETADIVFAAELYEFHYNSEIPRVSAGDGDDHGDGMPFPLGTS